MVVGGRLSLDTSGDLTTVAWQLYFQGEHTNNCPVSSQGGRSRVLSSLSTQLPQPVFRLRHGGWGGPSFLDKEQKLDSWLESYLFRMAGPTLFIIPTL